jgi:hypothetical protein
LHGCAVRISFLLAALWRFHEPRMSGVGDCF